MSKIKAFSFFVIILVILVATSYFLNTKKIATNKIFDFGEKNIEVNQEESDNTTVVLNENKNTNIELEPDNNQDTDPNTLEILDEETIDNLILDDNFVPDTSEAPTITEVAYLNKAAEISKNYVLNNQRYIDDKGFGLTIINVAANDCQDCWSAEIIYELVGPLNEEGIAENYFKNVIINLEKEEITEVIWEGQILDINN